MNAKHAYDELIDCIKYFTDEYDKIENILHTTKNGKQTLVKSFKHTEEFLKQLKENKIFHLSFLKR